MSSGMSFRAVLFLLGVLLSGLSLHADETRPEPKPGLISRMTNVFHSSDSKADKTGSVQTKNLTLKMVLSPLPLNLSETRQLNVTLSLANKSGKTIRLEFPTTQRFEILVRDKSSGRQVVQWSEDQAFEPEQTIITINSHERIQYEASVATRDLSPGKEYVVEASFPKYKELKIQQAITPKK